MEQSEYQYRPKGEEEIMRIYGDGIYCPLDMIEKPGGLHIEGYRIRDGGSCSLQAAPHHHIVEAYSDLELDELLRDTPNLELLQVLPWIQSSLNSRSSCYGFNRSSQCITW